MALHQPTTRTYAILFLLSFAATVSAISGQVTIVEFGTSGTFLTTDAKPPKGADIPVVNGATVYFSSGFLAGDTLSLEYNGRTVNGERPNATYNANLGILTITGQFLSTDYTKKIIPSIKFNTSAVPKTRRVLDWALGMGTMYNRETAHFYEFVPIAGYNWDNARAYCSGKHYFGLTGYLATVTTAEENDFIHTLLSQNAYLGGAVAANGEWTWSEGPEGSVGNGAGRYFWKENCNTVPVSTTEMRCTGQPTTCVPVDTVVMRDRCTITCQQNMCPWQLGSPSGSYDANFVSLLFKNSNWMNIPSAALNTGFVCEYGDFGVPQPVVTNARTYIVPECQQFDSSDSCLNNNYCAWKNNGKCKLDACTGSSADKLTPIRSCTEQSGCSWDVGHCVRQTCSLRPAETCEDDMLADGRCWDRVVLPAYSQIEKDYEDSEAECATKFNAPV